MFRGPRFSDRGCAGELKPSRNDKNLRLGNLWDRIETLDG